MDFKKNNRTSDHILTLKAVVNKYVVDQKGKKIYTCFVDFQKAILFGMMACLGNWKPKASMVTSSKLSKIFVVKQNVLSNLITRHNHVINKRWSPKKLGCTQRICKKWKLNINHKKTKCMTFSKGSNTKKDNFTIHSKNIANTKIFKYLGITINCKNCTFTQN